EQQLLNVFEVVVSTLEGKLQRIDNLDKAVEHLMRRVEALDSRVADNIHKNDVVISKLLSLDNRLAFDGKASDAPAKGSLLDTRLVLLDQKLLEIDSKLEVLKNQIDSNFLPVDDINAEASEKKPISMNVIEITKSMNAEVIQHVSKELDQLRTSTDSIDKKLQFHINIASENLGKMLRQLNDIHEAVVDQQELPMPHFNATTTTAPPPMVKASKIDVLVRQMRPIMTVSEKMDEVWDVVVGTKSSVDDLVPKSDALLTNTQRQERAIGEIHQDLRAKTNLIIENLDMVEKRLKKQEDDVAVLAQRPVPLNFSWIQPLIASSNTILIVVVSTLEGKLQRIDNLDKAVEHLMRRVEALDSRVADNIHKNDVVISKLLSLDNRLAFDGKASDAPAKGSLLDTRLVLLDQKLLEIDSKLEVLKNQIDSNFLPVDDINAEASEKKPISMNVIEITKSMNAEVIQHVSKELDQLRTSTDSIDKKLQFHINIASENLGKMLRQLNDIHEAVVDQQELPMPHFNATTTTAPPPMVKASKIDVLVRQMRPIMTVSEKMDEVWDVVVGTKSSVDDLVPKSDALLTNTQRQERAIGEIHQDLRAKTNLIIENLDMVEKRLKKQEDDVAVLAQRPVPAELLMDPTIDRLVEYDPNRYSIVEDFTEALPTTTYPSASTSTTAKTTTTTTTTQSSPSIAVNTVNAVSNS
uniref:Uncharacterized protein n=1 Tax=Lutzomyia longipalpis TaxID=7200 RepID=A0A1B0CHW3_LUTLO